MIHISDFKALEEADIASIRGAAMSLLSYIASAKMHGNSLNTILHAPMSFFDTTPLGRVLTVFGKDMDSK